MGALWRKYNYPLLLLLPPFQKSISWVSERSYSMLMQESMQNQLFTCLKYKVSWLRHAYATILKVGKQQLTKGWKESIKSIRKVACSSVDSAVVQASIGWFQKRWFNGCTSVDLAVVQALIWQFNNHGFNSFTSIDHCASIESTVTIVKSMVKLIM